MSSPSEPCCPIVVDPFCVLAILALIAFFTYILNIAITMTLGRRKRRKRELESDLSGLQLRAFLWTGMPCPTSTTGTLRRGGGR